MISIRQELSDRIRQTLDDMGLDGEPLLFASRNPRFGDYQSNCAMSIASGSGRRTLAEEIAERIDVANMAEIEVTDPGFINFRIKVSYLGNCLEDIPPGGSEDRLGVPKVAEPESVVVDLSSPNLAKEMHVGHLRSTVIGDCVARCLEFAGHTVSRENHIGDWGTQFGMLVAHLDHVRPGIAGDPDDLKISDMEAFYVEAKSRFDADARFRGESRATVVALQRGDPRARRIWKAFCDESLRHCRAIYDRLNVDLVDRPESMYADGMRDVASRLEARVGEDGFVRISDGALCVFMDGFRTRAGEPLPLIVRKSDGGFNYASSDLAAIIHRVESLGATRLIYVVGLSQKQHFDMVFSAAKGMGWVADGVSLTHLGFGSMLAADGKPFKTRDGGTVKLKFLLDDAVARARRVVESQATDSAKGFSEAEINDIAETVGVAAVRYSDLSHAIESDYKFDPDRMTSLEGNTAPYMLYAVARIRSIARKSGVDAASLYGGSLRIEHPTEVALALRLLRFEDTVTALARDLRPNMLTEYLFDLAKSFSRFYDKREGVRVIDAPADVRGSRLRLCDITARALTIGLGLLGIGTLDKM